VAEFSECPKCEKWTLIKVVTKDLDTLVNQYHMECKECDFRTEITYREEEDGDFQINYR